MDLNNDGLIDFIEWIKYLIVPPEYHLEDDPDVFNYELKMKFDIYDINNDGQISLEELYYMM